MRPLCVVAILVSKCVCVQRTLSKRSAYHYPSTSAGMLCYSASHQHGVDEAQRPSGVNALAWGDSELDLWLAMQRFLQATWPRNRHLDIGCGFGRITIRFGWLFGMTTCLEADAVHMMHAKKAIATYSKKSAYPGRRVEYEHARFLDFYYDFRVTRRRTYDAITCIQVIQHISTKELPLWLRAAHVMLRKGGLFVLATRLGPHPRLTIEEKPVDEETFNRRATGEDVLEWGKAKGGLAVRVYGFDELARMATRAGFTILHHAPFMFRKPTEASHQVLILTKLKSGDKRTVSFASLKQAAMVRVKDIYYTTSDLAQLHRMRCTTTCGVHTPNITKRLYGARLCA